MTKEEIWIIKGSEGDILAGCGMRRESAIGADRKGISSGRSRARESFGSYRAFPLRKTSGLFYGAVKYDLGFN